jgi:hypothetical protein
MLMTMLLRHQVSGTATATVLAALLNCMCGHTLAAHRQHVAPCKAASSQVSALHTQAGCRRLRTAAQVQQQWNCVVRVPWGLQVAVHALVCFWRLSSCKLTCNSGPGSEQLAWRLPTGELLLFNVSQHCQAGDVTGDEHKVPEYLYVVGTSSQICLLLGRNQATSCVIRLCCERRQLNSHVDTHQRSKFISAECRHLHRRLEPRHHGS